MVKESSIRDINSVDIYIHTDNWHCSTDDIVHQANVNVEDLLMNDIGLTEDTFQNRHNDNVKSFRLRN